MDNIFSKRSILFGLSIIAIISFIITIIILYQKNPLKNNQNVIVSPVSGDTKSQCSITRVNCNNKEDCIKSCNDPVELECVNLDIINPRESGDISGGGKVCLPSTANKSCDQTKGGVYLWTGYGDQNLQEWQCYCMYPQIYGNSNKGCTEPNPAYCSGGVIGTINDNFSCTCPGDKIKMFRSDDNTPFCISPKFNSYSDVHSWNNIVVRPYDPILGNGVRVSLETWAGNIQQSVLRKINPLTYKSNNQSIVNILNDKNNYTNENKNTLNKTVADKICKLLYTVDPTNICQELCDNNIQSSKFIDVRNDKVKYSYYDNIYRDESSLKCL